MKKRDWMLIVSVLAVAFLVWGCSVSFPGGRSRTIRISIDGQTYGEYSLDRDQIIPILLDGEEINVCETAGGKVKMIHSSCPDHLCEQQRAVTSRGGTIICLPNRVVIEAISPEREEEKELDGIAG